MINFIRNVVRAVVSVGAAVTVIGLSLLVNIGIPVGVVVLFLKLFGVL